MLNQCAMGALKDQGLFDTIELAEAFSDGQLHNCSTERACSIDDICKP